MSWQRIRTLNKVEFSATLKALKLKQAQAARLLGLSERHIRRVIRGEARLPEACCMVLAALMHYHEAPIVPKRTKYSN
jgi:plasmid maintenance system antidote protein VapI